MYMCVQLNNHKLFSLHFFTLIAWFQDDRNNVGINQSLKKTSLSLEIYDGDKE